MKKLLLIPLFLWVGTLLLEAADHVCTPNQLLCDYLIRPLGIDNPNPRLYWRLDDVRQGAKQTAYQLWVGTDSLEIVRNQGNQWDTGKQLSDVMLLTYKGKALQPFTKYYWKIKVWDKDGVPIFSPFK